MINGRSRMVLNHRLLNLSFNTTVYATKTTGTIQEKHTNGRSRIPVDTGRKLNVHKTFRRHLERLMYVQFTFCVYWDGFKQ